MLHIIGHTNLTNVGFQIFAKCYVFNNRLLNSTTNYFWQDQLFFIMCVKALLKCENSSHHDLVFMGPFLKQRAP
jgi:hypothetical protein